MATSGPFIEGADGLTELSEAAVELEDDLQALVARYPPCCRARTRFAQTSPPRSGTPAAASEIRNLARQRPT